MPAVDFYVLVFQLLVNLKEMYNLLLAVVGEIVNILTPSSEGRGRRRR